MLCQLRKLLLCDVELVLVGFAQIALFVVFEGVFGSSHLLLRGGKLLLQVLDFEGGHNADLLEFRSQLLDLFHVFPVQLYNAGLKGFLGEAFFF